ncbi:hypothetical protein SPRG_08584 [Saprolegnia parasitica CBS 223.65]|uniref:RING-type domain-containing protein n=1 Tax=Saprolegnia parasitica (strain CBS 223.65) TaxID=695850 RepID=A0A067CHG2_SAPPC|nr:hypothetical protein SPRG_08584 [Saprolegnia parasitica CBS 223.65]KDO26222.1 hypothetical protein SPRG_08584 [Saprolegnia parasitica CBS 223.65]|eukprot:XP_012203214.1 hypothetical protein SPRG_08584 [Saprolegnia parasitica CBS 223.65]
MTTAAAIDVQCAPSASRATRQPKHTCAACYAQTRDVVTAICGASCPAIFCRDCFLRFLQIQVASHMTGIVRGVACPICIRPVSFRRLRALAPKATSIGDLQAAVVTAVSVCCPACHCTKSLLPNVTKSKSVEAHLDGTLHNAAELLATQLPASVQALAPVLLDRCSAYSRYEVSAQDLFGCVRRQIPLRLLLDQTLTVLVRMFGDVERQARLYLCWRQHSPFTATMCCKHDICFACKTSGHHEGEPCGALQVDAAMAQCPHCAVYLTKGDGCDSVQCFCGGSFSWATEARKFADEYVRSRINPRVFPKVLAFLRRRVQQRRFRATVLPSLLAATERRALRRLDTLLPVPRCLRSALLQAVYRRRYRTIVLDMPVHLLQWRIAMAAKRSEMIHWIGLAKLVSEARSSGRAPVRRTTTKKKPAPVPASVQRIVQRASSFVAKPVPVPLPVPPQVATCAYLPQTMNSRKRPFART